MGKQHLPQTLTTAYQSTTGDLTSIPSLKLHDDRGNIDTLCYLPDKGRRQKIKVIKNQRPCNSISQGLMASIPPVCVCMCTQRPTVCEPMDCSPPGSSVHGILWARMLERVAIPFCRGSSQPRSWTCVSFVFCIGRQILYFCAIWEAQYPMNSG